MPREINPELALRRTGKPSTNPDKKLTPKQRAFAEAWASGENITNSAKIAGISFPDINGFKFAKLPNVLAFKKKNELAYQQAAQKSREDVMQMHIDAFEMAKLLAEPATMVSAAREIGKMCGYYEPKKVDVTVSVSGSVKLEKMTDADLFKMLEAASQAITEEIDDEEE